MRLLFNHKKQGQEELVKVLGFLSSDFSYPRIRTFINLQTPKLYQFLSLAVYNKIVNVYETLPKLIVDEKEDAYYDDALLNPEQKKLIPIIELSRAYIGIMAYADYAPNNDLRHTTSGRKMDKTTDEVTPWEWQISKSDASLKKTAYQVLDRLVLSLEEIQLKEWLNSSARKKATNLFVSSTAIFNDKYPIDSSEQLYYRLVPFMEDIELLKIYSRLGKDLFEKLKIAPNLSSQEKAIKIIVQEIVVYQTLIKGYRLFPIEMFPDKIDYNRKTRNNTEEMVRENVIIHLEKYLREKYLRLETMLKQEENTTDDNCNNLDLLKGLDENSKHIDL